MREAEAIAAVLRKVPVSPAVRGPGDDAAVLPGFDGNLVVATDFVIENRHFRLEWSTLADAAYRAVARNVSDLAAMGADPVAFVAAVAMPDADAARVDAIAEGLAEAAAEFGIGVAGGDLSRSDPIVFAVTVVGRVDGPGLGRDGARSGDLVAVTGTLGAAGAGLALLRRGDVAARQVLEAHPELGRRYRRGVARLDAGRALRSIAHAAIDLSDGLGIDAGRVAAASGVRIVLDRDALPIEAGVAEAIALTGQAVDGDDYELLVTLESNDLDAARRAVAPLALTVIGEVVAGPAGVVDRDGVAWEGGHEHFA